MTGAGIARAVLDYHTRTKHRFDRYAAGPETLDWDAQPDPFRRFEGTTLLSLPLAADGLETSYADLYRPGAVKSAALGRESIAILFELSLGLAAWKQYGSARWALRCNPSSGNLHPTEGYAVLPAVTGLAPGVHHYASREHAFERRCIPGDENALNEALGRGRFLIGLSSIHWREAWKYGERAFRYCQLDGGHAIAAIRYAAAALGWRVSLLDTWSDEHIAALLGLDREADFSGTEGEQPEAVLMVETLPDDAAPTCDAAALLTALNDPEWHGRANVLDKRHFYEWPAIDEIAAATRKPPTQETLWTPTALPPPDDIATMEETASRIIRQRRSTQAYDGNAAITAQALFHMLDRLLPRPGVAPWDALHREPRVHPVLFVHRVEGLPPGLYALPRRPGAAVILRDAMRDTFLWESVADCPEHLPLAHLLRADARNAARTLSCHQDIAGHAAFSLAMLAEFADEVSAEPWAYRRLYWEAGMLGQVLYLDAEALGLRGTGIGCFFDDPVHETLGLEGEGLQSLYHFAVGLPLTDSRLITLSPYHHLPAERRMA